MSQILGLASSSPEVPSGLLDSVLDSSAGQSPDRRASLALGRGALAVRRADWELGPDFSDGALAVREDSLAIVADASLYYREDLLRKLARAGVQVPGSSPSHLILGAYRAWGIECAGHLEGDFAFILWDAQERRLHAARDFSGHRPLYYAMIGETLVVASTIGAIRAFPGWVDTLNLTVLGETASAIIGSAEETCYTAISALAPGTSLTYYPGREVEITRHWEPPVSGSGGSVDFEAGALELRELLAGAVRERLPGGGPAALSLSGGWDSTAVFGSAQEVIRTSGSGELRAVSLSYPPGDTGREDDFILQTTGRWNTAPHWLHMSEIPLFHRALEDAGLRDEPFVHPFEQANRALAEAGRRFGARVMFDGFGGDQLFIASTGLLAFLLGQGRWKELVRQWLQMASRLGLRTQFRYVLLPILPAWMLDLATEMRGGRELRGHFQRLPAAWIRRDFAERHHLRARQHRIFPPGQRDTPNAELRYYLTAPIGSTSIRCVSRYSLEAGMEQRSPLLDQRVVTFAAGRPWEERYQAGESKRVLRRAVRGLVPDSVLAPRRYKTGTSGQSFARSMRRDFPALARVAFARPILPELGIVDLPRLREAVESLEAGRSDAETTSQLFFTLHTEAWLQALVSGEGSTKPCFFRSSRSSRTSL